MEPGQPLAERLSALPRAGGAPASAASGQPVRPPVVRPTAAAASSVAGGRRRRCRYRGRTVFRAKVELSEALPGGGGVGARPKHDRAGGLVDLDIGVRVEVDYAPRDLEFWVFRSGWEGVGGGSVVKESGIRGGGA